MSMEQRTAESEQRYIPRHPLALPGNDDVCQQRHDGEGATTYQRDIVSSKGAGETGG
jgi:hypothetical protein